MTLVMFGGRERDRAESGAESGGKERERGRGDWFAGGSGGCGDGDMRCLFQRVVQFSQKGDKRTRGVTHHII